MKVQATAIEAIKIINNLHLGRAARKLPLGENVLHYSQTDPPSR